MSLSPEKEGHSDTCSRRGPGAHRAQWNGPSRDQDSVTPPPRGVGVVKVASPRLLTEGSVHILQAGGPASLPPRPGFLPAGLDARQAGELRVAGVLKKHFLEKIRGDLEIVG